MVCSYCNNEMEVGVIQSPNEISWSKKKRLFARAELYKDSIVLAEWSFVKGSSVEAYLCRKCKKIVIEFE